VNLNIAAVSTSNGRIKAVRLIASAETHAQRIGPPAGAALFGTRFITRERLDGGTAAWKHHVRALYRPPE
jgi:hypothetical protein